MCGFHSRRELSYSFHVPFRNISFRIHPVTGLHAHSIALSLDKWQDGHATILQRVIAVCFFAS